MLKIRRKTAVVAAIAALLMTGGGLFASNALAASATCTKTGLNNGCGQYDDSNRPAFIENQDIGTDAGTSTTSITTNGFPATAPPVFVSTVTVPDVGGRVQIFPSVQEQFYGWDGTGWNCQQSSCYDTQVPLSALSALSITYDETSPQDAGSQYEFSPDIWSNYPQDVMMWADTTSTRCQSGGYGTEVLGQAVIDGQNWTVTRYGPAGSEMIFVLNGPGGLKADGEPVSCARQTSGTLNIKAAYEWMVAHGLLSSPTIYMVNSGWEITQSDNTNYTLNSYTVNAPIAGSPTPTPTPTTTTPTPTPTPTVTTPPPSNAPAVPKVVAVGNGHYFLWQPVAGATKYQLLIENSSGTVLHQGTTAGTWLSSYLTPMQYKVQYRALVGGTWTAYSTAKSFS